MKSSQQFKQGDKVNIVGAKYLNHNMVLRWATVMANNEDGTFDIRVLSEINGFIILKDVSLQDITIPE